LLLEISLKLHPWEIALISHEKQPLNAVWLPRIFVDKVLLLEISLKLHPWESALISHEKQPLNAVWLPRIFVDKSFAFRNQFEVASVGDRPDFARKTTSKRGLASKNFRR